MPQIRHYTCPYCLHCQKLARQKEEKRQKRLRRGKRPQTDWFKLNILGIKPQELPMEQPKRRMSEDEELELLRRFNPEPQNSEDASLNGSPERTGAAGNDLAGSYRPISEGRVSDEVRLRILGRR
jgi:hypothetical protein